MKNSAPTHLSKISPKRSKQLADFLKSLKTLAILTHNTPDPDAIASSLILQNIAKKFGVKATIFFSGTISRSENIKMLEVIKIKPKPFDEKKVLNRNAIAVVDCQIGMGNLTAPPHISANLTFDHHVFKPDPPQYPPTKKPTKQSNKTFTEITLTIGATATLLMDYYLNYGFELTTPLANAFVYALHAETKYFSRDTSNRDISVYKAVLPFCNLRTISEISHAKKSVDYFKAMEKMLRTYKISNRIASCNYGNIDNPEYVHQLAEMLASLENVDVSVIAAKHKGVGRISARANLDSINVGNSMKESMSVLQKASGGGHPSMAAGIFYTSTASALNSFLKTQNSLFSQLKKYP